MSRNDSRHGSRGRGEWNRDYKERERDERNGRSDRRQRNERGSVRGDKNSRNERFDRIEKRGSDARTNEKRQEPRRHSSNFSNQKEIQERENAIKEFKGKFPVCEICGQPITDIASAMSNKEGEKPVHFDCVLNKLIESEKPKQNEKLSYIGQGRFAVLDFENPRDSKHFKIKKIIEWEKREQDRGDWRNEMAGLYSQVK